MREPPEMLEERLSACIQNQYQLAPVSCEFLPLGRDYSAWGYRVMSAQGISYFAKVTARPLYEPALSLPRYLNDQGISSVVAPLFTKNHALWTAFEQWRLIVYPWISGESNWSGMTSEHWKELGRIFRRIHEVPLPAAGFLAVRTETFHPGVYTQWMYAFENGYLAASEQKDEASHAVCVSWLTHQDTIHTGTASLEKLAARLQARTIPNVICHADLHANNVIRQPDGQVSVIDWDEVMLAPRERDFIFIRKPYAAAFWEGYGTSELDWELLAYYLWERVVQDIIEDTKNGCLRDDLSQESRAEIARGFAESLIPNGNNLAAAYEASAHLSF